MQAIVVKNQSFSDQGDKSAFSFTFISEDGSPILRGNRYRSKDSAYKGVRAVKRNCIRDNRYIIERGVDGKHSFKIKSANGVPIVDSITFSSEQEMQEHIKLIKARIPDCEVDFKRMVKFHR